MKHCFLSATFFFIAFFGFVPQTHAALSFDYVVICGNNITTAVEKDAKGNDVICYYGECSVCDAQIFALHIINILIFLAVLLATVLFLQAGISLVFSSSNPGAINGAKKMFWSALVGLGIILGAWLAVDTVMKTLYSADGTGWGPWNEMLCKNNSEKHCVPKIQQAVLVGQTFDVPKYTDKSLDCEKDLGGTCARSCDTGVTGRSDTSCLGSTPIFGAGSVCCLPKTMSDTCTLANGANAGKQGSCLTSTFCPDSKEVSSSCAGSLVCCPANAGRTGFDIRDVPSNIAKANLESIGVQFGGGYTNGTNPVKKGTVDDLIAMQKACGCILVTSLTAHDNANSRHLGGEKSDVDYSRAKSYIEGWTSMDPRAGDHGGPQFYNATLGTVCVHEVNYNHFDCCHNWSQTECK